MHDTTLISTNLREQLRFQAQQRESGSDRCDAHTTTDPHRALPPASQVTSVANAIMRLVYTQKKYITHLEHLCISLYNENKDWRKKVKGIARKKKNQLDIFYQSKINKLKNQLKVQSQRVGRMHCKCSVNAARPSRKNTYFRRQMVVKLSIGHVNKTVKYASESITLLTDSHTESWPSCQYISETVENLTVQMKPSNHNNKKSDPRDTIWDSETNKLSFFKAHPSDYRELLTCFDVKKQVDRCFTLQEKIEKACKVDMNRKTLSIETYQPQQATFWESKPYPNKTLKNRIKQNSVRGDTVSAKKTLESRPSSNLIQQDACELIKKYRVKFIQNSALRVPEDRNVKRETIDVDQFNLCSQGTHNLDIHPTSSMSDSDTSPTLPKKHFVKLAKKPHLDSKKCQNLLLENAIVPVTELQKYKACKVQQNANHTSTCFQTPYSTPSSCPTLLSDFDSFSDLLKDPS